LTYSALAKIDFTAFIWSFTMSKKFMIDHLAAATGVAKKDITAVLEALPKAIETAVAADGRVVLPNVASFKRVDKAERMGRNPQTGAALVIAARTTLKIVTVGELQKAIDKK
jgi:DNA-binding protein HU-beta